ncbi:MAG: hypothetical protein RIQ59_1580 [Bacteroidota bacterium]|jgi:hypothetical protein
MKKKWRFISYFILFIFYLIVSNFASYRNPYIDNIIISAGIYFSIIDIIFAFYFLHFKSSFNIFIGILLAYLSLFLAFKFSDLRLFENYDAYNIKTVIFCNAINSIILWELLYQIKNKNIR